MNIYKIDFSLILMFLDDSNNLIISMLPFSIAMSSIVLLNYKLISFKNQFNEM